MKAKLLFLFLVPFSLCFSQNPLSKPFDDCKVTGSITIYDYNAKKWISSDINDSHVATIPASTFKIINSLIALELGIVKDENEIVKYPGYVDTVKYGYRPETYHDMSLKEAYKLSCIWVYLDFAKKIGKERYKDFLTKCKYGNLEIFNDDPEFWVYGNFAISPVNQIEILKGIYEESLPFSKRTFEIMKDVMIEEKTDTYTLRTKTGWTNKNGKDIGWWVGYVERKDNVYFFATRIFKDRRTDPDFLKYRKSITKTILKELKIIE